MTAYDDRCDALALPAAAIAGSIECKSADELADAGHASEYLAKCTALLEEHKDPCVGLTYVYDEPLDGGAVRDSKADLREELHACVREPISKVTRAPFADDCAAWRDAITRYRRCDPAVVPAVTSQTRCVDDDDLPESRTVRDCAELLWDRVSALCEVPIGAMRSHCLEEVIAD